MEMEECVCEVKRRRQRKKIVGIDDTRKRKRNNRESANRNDYGNEGFLLMIFYYLGCEILLKKLKKEGKNQKLKIESITLGSEVLLSRELIEKQIEDSNIIEDKGNVVRTKRIMTTINIDNKMLDILKEHFGFIFEEVVKKKPEKEFMPERRVIEHIALEKEWDLKSIIYEGVQFYDNVKMYGKDSQEIQLSQALVAERMERTSQQTEMIWSVDNSDFSHTSSE